MWLLYQFPLCPFSRKVRLLLSEKRVTYDLVREDPWAASDHFYNLNPAGRTPVLVEDERGIVLADSRAICEYLEEKYPEPPLMPRSADARYEVRRLVGWFDDKFHHEVTKNLVYERVNKKVMRAGYPDGKAVKSGATAIKFHLRYMEWLLDHRRWLAGDRMTMADFAAAAHLSCLDYISDVDWTASAIVKDWYATMKSRPAFRSILSDHVSGFAQPPHYAFLVQRLFEKGVDALPRRPGGAHDSGPSRAR